MMGLFRKKKVVKKPVKKTTTKKAKKPVNKATTKKAKKPVKKKVTKKTTKKKTGKAFGGYCISFKDCKDTIEDVFGKKDLAPSEMTKAIWAYVKKKKLAGKK